MQRSGTALTQSGAHLGVEGVGLHGGVVLAVSSDVATTDVLDGDVLDVEANVVTGESLGQRLVVHLNGLHLSGDVGGGEGDDHVGLEDTGLNTAHGYCSNTWKKSEDTGSVDGGETGASVDQEEEDLVPSV